MQKSRQKAIANEENKVKMRRNGIDPVYYDKMCMERKRVVSSGLKSFYYGIHYMPFLEYNLIKNERENLS